MLRIAVLFLGFFFLSCQKSPQIGIQHYLYFPGSTREEIRQDTALKDPRFKGAQIVYSWRSLEPEKDHYDFTAIESDIEYLASLGKKVWVQLQEKSFNRRIKNVPDYLLEDPLYLGGVVEQSNLSAPERDPNALPSDDDSGWVVRMWDDPVRERYQNLLRELGKSFDGKIAGINFSESSIDLGIEQEDGTTIFPEYFHPKDYVEALHSNMRVLKSAFKKSIAMVYLNFLPDEWLPWNDKGYMKTTFALAKDLQMGIGGPDLMPYRKSHMNQSYGFFHEYPNHLIKGMAVQDGNLRQVNSKTNQKMSVADILDFSKNYLGLHYIFWAKDEPNFTQEVLKELPYES